jgi:PleD family two-component response regulator
LVTTNQDLLSQFRKDLATEGFQVDTLANLSQVFLHVYQNNHYRTILFDLESFGTEAYEVCQRIKNEEQLKFIPIICIIDRNKIPEKLLAFEMGADDFILMPYSPYEIQLKIRSIQRLMDTQKRLQEKDIQIQNFRNIHRLMVTLNHYINNALTPLYSFIQMMDDSKIEDGQRLKHIAEKTVHIIIKILDVLQQIIESGEYQLVKGGVYQDLLIDIEKRLKEMNLPKEG